MKNKIIYSGFDEKPYNELLHQYKANESEIFFLIERQTTENDPFRPNELPKQRHATVELSKINSTKPRELKDDQIIVENEVKLSKSTSILTIKTGYKPLVSIKENVNMSYSVELCQTKRTQNNKHKAALEGYPDSIDKNADTLQPQRRKLKILP
ncbi:hypothetical protein F8M41_003895 [Gigaspora margarita]|uniref:Uncharacterized protein n=1 Tax=Gigaspora margarita TaxID=4874 RepID=A0A8H4AY44_GIGMA|nr:hypothetical protein F8M41_003895 [Gigaspora margarita]